jgi:hypothetical protein
VRRKGTIPPRRDIGYWAPDGDLVFYYDDAAPYFNGIVRVGELDGDMQTMTRQSNDLPRHDRAGGMTYR